MNGTVFAETMRRHLTSAGYVSFLLFLAMVGLFASTFHHSAAMWPSLVSLLAMITGAALIGPEFSTGALQLIVSKPIRRTVYLISRVAGVLATIALAGTVPFLIEATVRAVVGTAGVPWERLAAGLINALFASLLVVALLVLFGSMTRAYFNVAIYFGIQIALSVVEAMLGLVRVRGGAIGEYLQRSPGVERAISAAQQTLFPDRPPTLDAMWLLRVALTAAVALVVACLVFQRREVPYGAE